MPKAPPIISSNHLVAPTNEPTLVRLVDALQQHASDAHALLLATFDIVCQSLDGVGGCIFLATPQLELAYHHHLPTQLLGHLHATLPNQVADPVTWAQNTFAQFDLTCAALPLVAQERVLGIFTILGVTAETPTWFKHAGDWIGNALDHAQHDTARDTSAAWVREFLEQAPDAMFESDLNGRVCFVNAALCTLLEYTRAEMLEKHVTDFLVSQDAFYNEMREKLHKTGSLVNVLTDLRAKSGAIKAIFFSSRMRRDSQGNPCGFQTIIRDVTNQEPLISILNRRNVELNALNNIAAILSRPFELASTLTQVCKQIATITGMETVAVFLNDPQREFLNLIAHQGVSPEFLVHVQRLGLDDPFTRRVAVEGQIIAIDDVMLFQGEGFAGPRALGYHAGIGVPVRQHGEPIGTIFVGSKVSNHYQPADVNLLINVGNQIGVALDNADLYLQMQKRLRELDGLARLSANLVSSLDQHTIAEHTIECLRALFDTDLCNVRISENGVLRLYAAFTRTSGLHLAEQIPLDDEMRAGLLHRHPFVVNDTLAPKSVAHPAHAEFATRELRALLVAPFFAHNHFAGALGLLCLQPHNWQPGEIELAQTIANQVGLAIEKADLYAQTQDRVRELEGLAQLSTACSRNLDLATILDSTLHWTKTLLHADIADVRRIQDKHVELFTRQTSPAIFTSPGPIRLNELWVVFVEKRAPLVIEQVKDNPQIPSFARDLFLNNGIAAILAVPLIAQDQVIGVLGVIQHAPRRWSQHEIDLLYTIANQTTNAIYNAQLFQQVVEEQGQSKAILESCLNGLYVTDRDGRIINFNPAATQMTGWRHEDALNTEWQTIFADANGLDTESLIGKVVTTRQPVYPIAGRMIRQRFGAVIPILEAAAPLLDENGNVTRIIGTFWDLSRERQAELERAELLELFMHELRTPLTALGSAAELLEKEHLKKDLRAKLLKILKSESTRVRKFSHDFIQKQNAFAPLTPVDLNAVALMPIIYAITQRFQMDSHSHQFQVNASHPSPIALADHERVEHILGNLIENAVNYSPDQSLITISVTAGDENIEIAVQDQGKGIPLEEQELVFQRYYRAKNSSGRVPGYGLGLAMVRKMVAEMQGTVWVESRPGQGATFRFTLKRQV